MQKIVFTILAFRIFIPVSTYTISQVTPETLLDLSRRYYKDLTLFSICIHSEFKSSLRLDTLKNKTEFYIDKNSQTFVFKTEQDALVKVKKAEYIVSYNPYSYLKITKHKKHSAFHKEFKYFPQVSPDQYFSLIKNEITSYSQVKETDSFFLLNTSKKTISFRKKDYSIANVTERIYDPINKMYQYNKNIFHPVITKSDSINSFIQLTTSIIQNSTNKRNKSGDFKKPKAIDRIILKESLTDIINSEHVDIDGKIVLLDFFFQGCYPCVKSYPYVNSLFQKSYPNLVVIGVDQLESDTATIRDYINKYNLLYPILIGKKASILTQYFRLHSFPAFVLIDEDGKVIRYGNGFTKSSFNKIVNQNSKFFRKK